VAGVHSADAIAKGTPVERILTGTAHPGKYVVLVTGDTAAVDVARDIVAGLGRVPIDTRFLPDIARSVVASLVDAEDVFGVDHEAIGVVETTTVSSGIDAADAAVKAADVVLAGVRMADGLGGKAYLVVDGTVSEVEAAVDAACDRAGAALVDAVVIPRLTDELREDLASTTRFVVRVRDQRGTAS
jgi:microcompartment protein CcmL/EutN